VQRLWEGLAREFAKRGHEVTVFAREFTGQAKEETVEGIRYVRRGGYGQSTSIKRDLVQCLFYALTAARHVPPGDVVVTNDFWMPAVLPWLNPSAGKVVPCLQRFPKRQASLYGRCAALVAVSQAVADGVRAQSPSVASKVVIVPNAIDEVFLEGTKGLRDYGATGQATGDGGQTAGGRQPVRILYVGRIHPEKGLGLLVKALRVLAARDQKTNRPRDEGTKWECVLVGPVQQSEGGGGEAFVEELKRQVQDLPVRFEGAVYNPTELAQIYKRADIFVYPSTADTGEAMPLAPLEAMARGLVPVVSDLKAFREYLKPDANGMVFDHRGDESEANLAKALGELVADAKKREQMSVAARTTAENFSMAVIADKYLQLFAKVISGR